MSQPTFRLAHFTLPGGPAGLGAELEAENLLLLGRELLVGK